MEGISALERADVLGFALLATALGPQLVVGILRELAETVGAVGAGNLAHDREGVVVLEIDDSSLERSVGLVDDLAIDGALHGAAALRYGDLWQNQTGGRSQTSSQGDPAGKRTERKMSTLHKHQYTAYSLTEQALLIFLIQHQS